MASMPSRNAAKKSANFVKSSLSPLNHVTQSMIAITTITAMTYTLMLYFFIIFCAPFRPPSLVGVPAEKAEK